EIQSAQSYRAGTETRQQKFQKGRTAERRYKKPNSFGSATPAEVLPIYKHWDIQRFAFVFEYYGRGNKRRTQRRACTRIGIFCFERQGRKGKQTVQSIFVWQARRSKRITTAL